MPPKQDDSTRSTPSQATSNSFRSEIDGEAAALDCAQQHVRPGSVADRAIEARRAAIEAVPDDPAYAAVWRRILGR